MIAHLPMESATVTAVVGDDARWGITEQLLAAIVDSVNVGNWQRGGDKKVKRPKPIPRPGVTDPGTRKFKARKSFTVAQMRDIQENWGQVRHGR